MIQISSIGNRVILRRNTYHMPKRGFSFIELLIAVAILSVGIVHVFRVLFSSLNTLQYVDTRLQAHELMVSKQWDALEIVRSKDLTNGYSEIDVTDTSPALTSTLQIQKKEHAEHLYEVQTVLTWHDQLRSVELTSTLYEYK